MRNLMLVAARVSLFSLVLVALAACIYVPPVWDAYDAINHVDDLEVGKSTRSQVLGLLGDPEGDPDGSALDYSGEHSDGYVMAGSTLSAAAGLINEERWWVTIYFDEEDVVQAACTSEDDSDERQACDREVEQWHEELQEELSVVRVGATREQVESVLGEPDRSESDADATVHVYRHQRGSANVVMYVTYGPDGTVARAETAAQWREAQAECGDADAQTMVRLHFDYLGGDTPKDLVRAYFWLSKAISISGHYKSYKTDIAAKMTPEQIAEAERLVAEWEPKDCTAEEIASPSD